MMVRTRLWLRAFLDPKGAEAELRREIERLEARDLLQEGRLSFLRERYILLKERVELMSAKDDRTKAENRLIAVTEALLAKLGAPVPDDPADQAQADALNAEAQKAEDALNPPVAPQAPTA